MELRPFNQDDWDCFAGCEDTEPLISDEEFEVTIDGFVFDGIVLVDKFTIAINLTCEEMEITDHPVLNEDMSIVKECVTKQNAVLDVGNLPNDPTADWLFLHGFQLIQ